MASLTEPNRLCDILKGEVETPPRFSREAVIIASGRSLTVGSVIGKITKSIPETGTAGGNTGNGTCTGVTGGEDTQLGTYTLTCTATTANGGTFAVTAPNGEALPDATVGAAYTNEQINFTLNDAGTDFALGDTFAITVAAGSGKVTAIDFTAVDGSQDAHGFLIADYDATAADVEAVAIVRDALMVAENLVWPDGATPDQKAAALAQLKLLGIVPRTEV